MLKWAEERLKALLTVGAVSKTVSFTKVHDVEGDALFTFRKGEHSRGP
jgi:hypothetical protein